MQVSTLIEKLSEWPEDTEVVVDVANVVEHPQGEYQWHELKVDPPKKVDMEGGSFTIIRLGECVGY